jgi:recombinational DNA repair protein (RecF pathway)
MALQSSTISEALVVRYVNYGESDRIVTILTPDHGLCSGFAHGARNSKRRFGPALQLFSRINILWQEGRYGSLRLLKEAELLEPAERVMPNLEAWALAAYASELVVALFPEEQAIPEVYSLLRSCFDALRAAVGWGRFVYSMSCVFSELQASFPIWATVRVAGVLLAKRRCSSIPSRAVPCAPPVAVHQVCCRCLL